MLKLPAWPAITLVLGMALAPLLICLCSGMSPGRLPEPVPGVGPDTIEGMALLDAYRVAFPQDSAMAPPIRRPDEVDRKCPITAALDKPLADPIVNALSEGGAKDRQDYRIITGLDAGQKSTGFGRRFLTACLGMPIYRHACRAAASGILKDAVKAAAYQMGEIRDGYRQAECAYFVGKATMSGSAERPVSTP